jgi:4-hydroxy-tetrahydrodipicolinate synthase
VQREELRGLLKGIIVATPTPFDRDFELDLGRMAELTQWWVKNGLVEGRACIKVASMMGEGVQLREDEWAALVNTTVQAAKGAVPVMAGIQDKDTRRTIEDAKRAQDLGVIGLQVSPPRHNDPTQDDILRYFEAVSDAIEIGIMVYHLPWMDHYIETDTFLRMADFKHVMAIKWSNHGGVPYEEMLRLTADFNILDNSLKPVLCMKLGGHGFLDYGAPAYPEYELRILDLIEGGRYDEAQEMWDRQVIPVEEFYRRTSKRSGGQARTKKGVMEVMGQPVGSMRPPSQPLNDEELDELGEILRSVDWPVKRPAAKAVDADG